MLKRRIQRFCSTLSQGKRAIPARFVFVLVLSWLSVIQPVRAEIMVIVNPDNPVDHLTREQVIDIYMGRYTHFPNGQIAAPIDLNPESPVRVAYYQKLVNKTVAQINSFWARLLFTGRATPPQVAPDAKTVINTVMHNREAIGYVDSQSLNNNVKVVYRLP